MTPSSGRQWTVFFAYTAWSVVLVLVMVPLGALALLGLSLPAAFAAHPIATAVLLVQILVGAWSGRRMMTAWSRAELLTGRDRWDLPRVGRLPVDAMLWA
ncbi:MAG: sensor histidine kinase, partial [Brachybacterium sp.]